MFKIKAFIQLTLSLQPAHHPVSKQASMQQATARDAQRVTETVAAFGSLSLSLSLSLSKSTSSIFFHLWMGSNYTPRALHLEQKKRLH
jgi:hypothetical protein